MGMLRKDGFRLHYCGFPKWKLTCFAQPPDERLFSQIFSYFEPTPFTRRLAIHMKSISLDIRRAHEASCPQVREAGIQAEAREAQAQNRIGTRTSRECRNA
jgi:hypothetical protein